MVSERLPSDALLQHLPSYFGFSYLGRGVSLHSCSSKVQLLLLTLDEVAPHDLERGVATLGPLAPAQLLLLGRRVAPLRSSCTITAWRSPSPPMTWVWGSSSQPRFWAAPPSCYTSTRYEKAK